MKPVSPQRLDKVDFVQEEGKFSVLSPLLRKQRGNPECGLEEGKQNKRKEKRGRNDIEEKKKEINTDDDNNKLFIS